MSHENLSPEEKWGEARRLHGFYRDIANQFRIELAKSPELDGPQDHSGPEALESASRWFEEMDDRLGAHHLRAYLQTGPEMAAGLLQQLIRHHLDKKQKSEADRDKVDYLLVQYFALCAPPGTGEGEVDTDCVARALEPVLHQPFTSTPEWVAPLEQLLAEIAACRTLAELLDKGVLEMARALKVSGGELFYEPAALLCFTRFNYLLRRVFFRLMHADVDAVFEGLRWLEHLKIRFVDATVAGLAEQEPLEKVREIAFDWKTPFRAEYSVGQPLRRLTQLRLAVEKTLEKATQPAIAKAAAVGNESEQS